MFVLKMADLWDAMGDDPVRFVSGATDLGLDVTQRFKTFPLLVDLGLLPGMREINPIDGGWRIGAGVLLSDLEAWSELHSESLGKMLRFFASRQIKNRATVGGNLCNASPIGDLPPVMLALNAVAVIRSEAGERRHAFSPTDSALGSGQPIGGPFCEVERFSLLLKSPTCIPRPMPRPTRSVNGVSWISVLYRVPLHSG